MAHPTWSRRPQDPELAAAYRSDGWWNDDTFGTFLTRAATDHAGLEARIWSPTNPYHATVGDLHDRARRVAGGLAARGIGAGDVVSYQIPNHVEAIVTFWAAHLLGAVVVPVVHFYGAHELGQILAGAGVRAHVTARSSGYLDHLAALDAVRSDLDALELVVVTGDGARPAGSVAFADLADADAVPGPVDVDADAPAVVAATSGTTDAPKCVVHSHRSLLAEVRQLRRIQPPDAGPMLIGAPMAHAIGLLGGVCSPLERAIAVHVVDGWDPAFVLDAMLEGDVAAGSGATFFLTSLLDHPNCTAEHLAKIDFVGLGGAPVPPAVGDRAAALGIRIARAYGSSEHPSVTGSDPDASHEERTRTDGRALPGVEMVLVDPDTGDPVPVGEPGEIRTRGPELCVGYTDPALTAAAFDDAGWYRTGDVGVLDEHGALTITDRLADVIIRGGENISAAEVENLVARVPGVAEVAVVAAPDARLGEHACAFVRVAPGAPEPDLPALRVHLEAAGLARQKWPEELRIVTDLPRTASGKVRKTDLRAQLRDEA